MIWRTLREERARGGKASASCCADGWVWLLDGGGGRRRRRRR